MQLEISCILGGIDVPKKETLIPGDYRVQVIADGHEIGTRTIELEK